MINRAFTKIFASNIAPSPTMNVIWMDIATDPYGSVLKYWNGTTYADLITGGADAAAPETNPTGGQNNYAPLADPSFTGVLHFVNSDASGYLKINSITSGATDGAFNVYSKTTAGMPSKANTTVVFGDIETKLNLIGTQVTLNGDPISTSNLNGANYLMVYGTGAPTENAAELQAAYDEAKTMPRYLGEVGGAFVGTLYKGQTFYDGDLSQYYIVDTTHTNLDGTTALSTIITEAEAKSVRTTVVVAPGYYTFGATAFRVDTPYINVLSLTGNSDIILKSTENNGWGGYIGVVITANNVNVGGLNCLDGTFSVYPSLNNVICENCEGLALESFCSADVTSGTFINCKGGDGAFGGSTGTASGVFIGCIGGNYSFGASGAASGTFRDCVGGMGSFGSGGVADGKFIHCVGGEDSFGGGGGFPMGIFESCKVTAGGFSAPTDNGKFINCLDADNNLINLPLSTGSSFIENTLTGAELKFSTVSELIPTSRELEVLSACGISLEKSNLSDLVLTGIKLYKANLSNSLFNNTSFANAKLESCKFDGAAFGGATLTGATLSSSNFTGALQLNANINIALAGAFGNNVMWTDGEVYSFVEDTWVIA